MSPKSLNNRHQLAAYLYAAGKSVAEVCELLSYAPAHFRIVAASPLFKARVAEIQREIGNRVISSVAEFTKLLEAEAIPTLKVITEIRDAPVDPDIDRVRLQAASLILPYVATKRAPESDRASFTVVLPDNIVDQMARTMRECGPGAAVDVTPTTAVAGRPTTEALAPKPADAAYIRPTPLDDVRDPEPLDDEVAA